MVYLYDGVPYSNTNEQIAISSNTDVLHNTMLSEKKEKTYRDFVHIKFKNRSYLVRGQEGKQNGTVIRTGMGGRALVACQFLFLGLNDSYRYLLYNY